jgi:hypothetical protein
MLWKLSTRQMMALAAVLLVADLVIPDPIPFVDEALLGLTVLLLARRRQPSQEEMGRDGEDGRR